MKKSPSLKMVRSSAFNVTGNSMKPFHPADYLSGLNIDVMRFGLEAITALLDRAGRPQNDFPAVLIGGTNGKGSTAVMLAAMLRQAGLRVGLYTSPHLVDVRERIVVNGVKIPRRELKKLLAEIRDLAREPITYFECLTAAAFLYFSRRRVDLAVLEVGLGGRLDATNVCRPLVSVITNIALEHTAWLGKTLADIACEKAGIIKEGGICLTAARQPKVLDVIEKTCRNRQAALFRLGDDFKIRRHPDGSVSYTGRLRKIGPLTVPLSGRHQAQNLALALAAVEVLEEKGYRIGAAAIARGLAKTRWPARLETLLSCPLFLLDGAHNPAGIATLCRTLRKDFSGRRLILIFSALADKNYRGMLDRIGPLAGFIFLPPLATGRAVAPGTLAAYAQTRGYPASVTAGVAEAVERALARAGARDVICACGSLYLAGEIKHLFPDRAGCGKTPAVGKKTRR